MRTGRRIIAVAVVFAALAVPLVARSASSQELASLTLINRARAAAHVAPLRLGVTLSGYSRKHSSAMAAAKKLWHQNMTVDLRTWHLMAYGENVGMGPSFGDIHAAFMRSPMHKSNILDRDYHWVGIGIVTSGGYTYETLNFTN